MLIYFCWFLCWKHHLTHLFFFVKHLAFGASFKFIVWLISALGLWIYIDWSYTLPGPLLILLRLVFPPPGVELEGDLPLVGFDVSPLVGVAAVTFDWVILGLAPILALLASILVLFPKAFDSCCTFPIGLVTLALFPIVIDWFSGFEHW